MFKSVTEIELYCGRPCRYKVDVTESHTQIKYVAKLQYTLEARYYRISNVESRAIFRKKWI